MIVIVPLTRDYHLSAPPQIVTRGFVFEPDSSGLLSRISEQAMEVLEKNLASQNGDLERKLCQQIEDYVYAETRRRPMVIPVLSRSYFS